MLQVRIHGRGEILMKATQPMKLVAACPAATVSSVITVTASVRITLSPNWARVCVSNLNMITARDVECAPWNAPAVSSEWKQRVSKASRRHIDTL